jgi:hypothetical protein
MTATADELESMEEELRTLQLNSDESDENLLLTLEPNFESS